MTRLLTSPILAGHEGLQEAATSAAKAVRMGETGDRVQALQHALAELGFTLANTMTKGSADGVYGQETYKAVRAFQQSTETVRPVGGHEAGPKTLKALDARLAGRHGTTPGPGPDPTPVPVGDRAAITDDPPSPRPTATVPTGLAIQPAAPGQLAPTGLPDKHPQSVASPSGTTAHAGAKEGFERFEAVAKLGWSGPFSFERGPESRFQWPKACDQGQFEVTGKLNLKGIPLDGRGRFTLLPELSLDVGVKDALCGKLPSLMANLTWWKFQAWKALEISMNSGLGLKGPPFGWVTKPAALEATMDLGKGFSVGASVEIEHSGEVNHLGKTDHTTEGKAGTFIEYRF